MGSSNEEYRDNNMIMKKAAPNSRNMNWRGRLRTASRASCIGAAWTSHDEDIENKSGGKKVRGKTERQ